MKPTHTRLTCRAHNRFSPSIALWQHFVGVDQPFLSQQRPSSNVASAVQHRASKDAGNSDPQVATAVVRPAEGGAPTIRKPVRGGLNIIKKYTRKGEWHTNKADASIAKNVRQQHATRQAESNASEKLLAVAREAYDAAEDYEGVVVEPMVHPTPVKEDNLPWSLPLQERGIPGIER
jgi:non-canonical poly(A) RNA polymerase PAPD5/7